MVDEVHVDDAQEPGEAGQVGGGVILVCGYVPCRVRIDLQELVDGRLDAVDGGTEAGVVLRDRTLEGCNGGRIFVGLDFIVVGFCLLASGPNKKNPDTNF